jgi:hypothetical protein
MRPGAPAIHSAGAGHAVRPAPRRDYRAALAVGRPGTAQLAVIASTEQTDAGAIREKEAKSGKSRTIALPSLAVEELRRWRLAQAEELLELGIRPDENWHVVTQADGSPLQPRSLTHVVSDFLKNGV